MAGTPLPPRPTLPIKEARAFPPNSDRNNPDRGDIAIAGGRIVDLAPDYDRDAEVEIIEARDNLVLPGFVNAHYHSHDVLAKGTLEELPLETGGSILFHADWSSAASTFLCDCKTASFRAALSGNATIFL